MTMGEEGPCKESLVALENLRSFSRNTRGPPQVTATTRSCARCPVAPHEVHPVAGSVVSREQLETHT